MKKLFYLLLLFTLLPLGSFAQKKISFEIKDGDFYLNGKPTPVLFHTNIGVIVSR